MSLILLVLIKMWIFLNSKSPIYFFRVYTNIFAETSHRMKISHQGVQGARRILLSKFSFTVLVMIIYWIKIVHMLGRSAKGKTRWYKLWFWQWKVQLLMCFKTMNLLQLTNQVGVVGSLRRQKIIILYIYFMSYCVNKYLWKGFEVSLHCVWE